ncbi:MAG TPA: iron-sulfur cluster assembly protein, partial [Cyclobacteriaceae bacterium]|nr:iron-sulfur cluster assembly protein [Cyclobacteriaceae bacterium]
MDISKEKVLKALSTVEDPDLKRDLVSLGMVQDVDIQGNRISFKVVLTTPACPLKELIKSNCVGALERELGEDIEL